MPPIKKFDLNRLFSALLNTGLQTKDNPLYQVIYLLIQALKQLQDIIFGTNITGGLINQSYLTVNNDTAVLPNSRQLLPGTNITFDDTIPGKRTINSTTGSEVFISAQLSTILVRSAEVELNLNKKNGRITVKDIFDENQIGQPVIITEALNKNSEAGIVQFVGEIINQKTMKVVWTAPFGAPRKTRINYIIGV